MVTYRFGLHFDKPGKGGVPLSPSWHIYIKNALRDEQGTTVVTPIDLTENEIDGAIDRLMAELESIRQNAKKEFDAWRMKKEKNIKN